MKDVSQAMEAKSDQLNAVDIIGAEPVIRIREVVVGKGEQPVSIYFDGDNGRPWKPSKGMVRILAAGWGRDASEWEGQYVKLYHDESVRYAGKEVGGIRIKGMSGIKADGIKVPLTLNRQQRIPWHVECITPTTDEYPADKFDQVFDAMVEKMHAEKDAWSLQQVIAKCHQTGRLTAAQLKRLEDAAPVEASEDDQPAHTGDDDEVF